MTGNPRRIAMRLGYDGTDFCGWQRQPNGRSVQQELERMLSRLDGGAPVNVVGAGRTDSGVHAEGQVAHADMTGWHDDAELLQSLQRMSPADLVVEGLATVKPDFHARYDAHARRYRYAIDFAPNPFRARYAWRVRESLLDISLLGHASAMLIGKHDFTSLSKFNPGTPNCVCDVQEATWEKREHGMEFAITADRFLYGMVRLVVGMQFDISRGKRPLEDILRLLARPERVQQSPAAPARGLTLMNVEYPEPIAGF